MSKEGTFKLIEEAENSHEKSLNITRSDGNIAFEEMTLVLHSIACSLMALVHIQAAQYEKEDW